MVKTPLFLPSKTLKAIHHRGTEGTEFYFVNSACGAVKDKELFSVLSVPLW
jgi:hypothetical protein